MEITDMHCHILPGLDDGSESMEETLDTLREAVRQGITRMIVTPHFHPQRYVVTAAQILQSLEDVRAAARDAGIGIELFAGQECYYYSELVDQLEEGNALTMCESRFVLVEFDPGCLFSYLLNGLQSLRQSGYIPVVAHFERYECLYKEDHLDELRRQQFLLQMNYDMLLRKGGLFRENYWQKILREGYVDFLGSDCHGTHFRPLQVDKACRWLEKKCDANRIRHILEVNFDKIVYG